METKSAMSWQRFQREQNPLRPTTKVLTLIQTPQDYCKFIKLMYASGYYIIGHAQHPKAITLDMNTFGYIECRDESKSIYKFVIYGCKKRRDNARVIYLYNPRLQSIGKKVR